MLSMKENPQFCSLSFFNTFQLCQNCSSVAAAAKIYRIQIQICYIKCTPTHCQQCNEIFWTRRTSQLARRHQLLTTNKKTKTKDAKRTKDTKDTQQSLLSAALWAEITNKWVFYFQQSKLEIPLFIFHQHYGEVHLTIDPTSTNLSLSPSLIASTGTGRKSSSATTTRWAWRSTLATRGREGRTRPSCTWCCPRRPTTAASPAITRWRETSEHHQQPSAASQRRRASRLCFASQSVSRSKITPVSRFSEPEPADLQLRHWEPDPLPQLWPGKPHEVWHQRKSASAFHHFIYFFN